MRFAHSLISQRLLSTREIILIHHTDCGMLTFTDDEVKKHIQAEVGIKPAFALEAFPDLEEDVRQSIARINASSFIPHKESVRGFIYEVKTGRLREIPPDGVGVLDAIKLVESGYAPLCHAVWVVTCPTPIQLSRLIEQRGLSPPEARARLAAQPPLAPKLAVASEVIENDGSLEQLRARVTAAWQRFRASLAGGSASGRGV